MSFDLSVLLQWVTLLFLDPAMIRDLVRDTFLLSGCSFLLIFDLTAKVEPKNYRFFTEIRLICSFEPMVSLRSCSGCSECSLVT